MFGWASPIYAARRTGGLQVFGDDIITAVISRHVDEVLDNPAWMEDDCRTVHKSTILLPKLPFRWEKLNLTIAKNIITSVMKDLNHKWTEDKPEWWPDGTPFINPRTAPQNWARGTCTCV